MFELRETGDWDIFLGPPERARAETGGADQWVSKRRELPGFARVKKVTSASLGYPPSVSNYNSTLTRREGGSVTPPLRHRSGIPPTGQAPPPLGRGPYHPPPWEWSVATKGSVPPPTGQVRTIPLRRVPSPPRDSE